VTEAVSHRWKSIDDLPEDVRTLTNPDLAQLASSWSAQQSALRGTAELGEFEQQLRNEWAVETGIVEGLYALPRPVSERLIREGVDASILAASGVKEPELLAGMVADQLFALRRIEQMAADPRGISTSDIKELHALITLHLAGDGGPMLKGAYKLGPNDVTRPDGSSHQFCPPEQVAWEMERLLELHEKHQARDLPADVQAAWLHHGFMQIAPFQAGNGLIARALATAIFVKNGWFPLIVRRDDLERYAAAQDRADAGDLKGLVDLFAFIQRRTLLEAPGAVGDSLRKERVDQVISSAKAVLEQRQRADDVGWAEAAEIAKSLLVVAEERLRRTADRMSQDLRQLAPDFRFEVDTEKSGGPRDYFFKWHIIESARQLDYFANLDIYRSWTRLMMRTATQDEILLSFHAVGDQSDGKIVATMCFYRRDRVQRGEENLADLSTVCDQLFEVDPNETAEGARERFTPWLEAGLVRGLELWHESLG